jgi:hypothetical protein
MFSLPDKVTINKNQSQIYFSGEMEKIILVLEGNGGLVINGNSRLLSTNTCIRLPKRSIITIANISSKNLIIQAIDTLQSLHYYIPKVVQHVNI